MPFTDTLLAWYEEHKRDLPWRGEQDPYKIWVSEIILQQTRVQQGWNYYLRFIETFPTVKALSEASEEQVLKVWQGLGYYSRARNMHYAAQQIMQDYNGFFPNKYEDIRKLKGIGDYTAAAVGSIAFNLPYPAIDGNVFRVICRIFGIFDDISAPATKKTITNLCHTLIDPQNPGRFNQAAMEFGAVMCLPHSPLCENCPFRTDCYAFCHQVVTLLPVKNNRIVKKERFFHYLFYIVKNQTIIEKRIHKDIWHNLYQFPLIETNSIDECPCNTASSVQLKEVLTHQIIYAQFYIIEADTFPDLAASQSIIDMEQIADFPMPKMMVQFLKKVEII